MTMERTAAEVEAISKRIDKLPLAPTAQELIDRKFDPLNWVIPGMVTTGLTIVAGAPKVCKSWMVLNWGWAIAVGGYVLGKIRVDINEVLYLALEDTERRLQDRLRIIGAYGSSKLYLPTQWPKGREAIQYLDAWMIKNPDTRCIIIDTLQKVSGIEDANSYSETYAFASELKKFADRNEVAVVVVHHTRKMIADDFLHTVQGSVGLTGAADTIMTITKPRNEHEGKLRITGRDVEEREEGIKFSPEIGTWELLDYIPETSIRKRG